MQSMAIATKSALLRNQVNINRSGVSGEGLG